jgi:hypothetical protein
MERRIVSLESIRLWQHFNHQNSLRQNLAARHSALQQVSFDFSKFFGERKVLKAPKIIYLINMLPVIIF